MKFTTFSSLNCAGCQSQCRDVEGNSVRDMNCSRTKTAIWPEDNQFFKMALNDILGNSISVDSHYGIIFVDFSIDNLLYFIHDEWIEFLSEHNMRIILLADKEMLPLAKYWANREWRIVSVLDVTEGTDKMARGIRKVMQLKFVPLPKSQMVSEREVKVLRYLSQGKSVADMARTLECSNKSIYSSQYSLCKKFGGLARLGDLRFKHQVN
ncbi:LuxR C-terminal-related transcriptional regulator [Entomohabitans teleogrylli]|uniref:LuxR C-terminal-related transcriptional regulator n=1 Tax=Entomohabitans teleogrylli TaxID=1384589 RepID=UPI0009EBB555|nr:LuxR C-terminal-related transcriptional regulator [Entomohabitans teleogrylli]